MGYLQQHLANLLFEHECVVIPELGGFVTNDVSARLNERTHVILPPGKSVSFNARLFHNDGVFAQDIRMREGKTYAEAMTLIRSEVAWLERQLDAGKQVQFEGVGILFKDNEGSLQFSPAAEANFDSRAIGLEAVTLNPVGQAEKVEEETPVVAIAAAKPAVERIENEDSRRRYRTLRNLAAAAAIPFLLFGGHLIQSPPQGAELTMFPNMSETSSDYTPRFEEEDIRLTPPNDVNILEEQVKQNPSLSSFYYSFVDDEISPDGVRIDLEQPEAELPVATPEASASSLNLYFVVGGAFREHANAEEFVSQLQSEGYDASIFGMKGDLHMVAYGSYANRASATKALADIRNDHNPNAWLKRK
ncbi:SPOR domain-containing protein [Sanyastnella coralliicola]|uniref:HU domain-containing protein n=1 Tax=Sanyastnella coralliicola TaxID=3069118 RepID=UPI0027BAFE15|nr:SPOR domain-containing protein [Longitalea sp. SCSIO 12813]